MPLCAPLPRKNESWLYSLQALPPPGERDWIAGLENGLAIRRVFDDADPCLTVSQAGALCGLMRTAARRYLLTPQGLGYIPSDGKSMQNTVRQTLSDPSA